MQAEGGLFRTDLPDHATACASFEKSFSVVSCLAFTCGMDIIRLMFESYYPEKISQTPVRCGRVFLNKNMNMCVCLRLLGVFCLAFVFGSACVRRVQPDMQVTFVELVERLADLTAIARLDLPATELCSSFDPTGGNDDYNRYLRQTADGWWVLADLQGPGYISRFWFTGGEPSHAVRLYFDNEKTPRIDCSIGEFCGGTAPFLPPLAAYENYCYYNYVPLPYARRVIVMVKAGAWQPGGWPRLFYQINYNPLSKSTGLSSFTYREAAGAEAALQLVRTSWSEPARALADLGGASNAVTLKLEPGATSGLPRIKGPAMIREMRVTPHYADLAAPSQRDRLLRDVIVRIRWNGSVTDSVAAPLGDFCGCVWRRTPFRSLFLGAEGDSLIARLPMPFMVSADVLFENQGGFPLQLDVACAVEAMPDMDGQLGYLHAAWRRSTPHDIGRPHEVLATAGRGRYAGLIMSVTTLDKNFWILEGDELMWRDGQSEPFWRGTGLEDYFNGGWYYQNVMTRPLHGLPFKSFFRTVQYRMHLPDPVCFQNAFRIIFERGPDHVSRGWIESMAYYYLAAPGPAHSELLTPEERLPPEDQFVEATIMMELCNYERFGDYAGARDAVANYIERFPASPHLEMLRLRAAAYTEELDGLTAAVPLYQELADLSTNALVCAQARQLLWFHENTNRALLGLYCNMPARCFVDGKECVQSARPDKMEVVPLELTPGRHVIALQARHQPYPDWVQVALRTHQGVIGTTTEWRHKADPSGAWHQLDYDDSQWAAVGGTGVKGPPEEPYILMEPNAFVNMQSLAIGLRPTVLWPDKNKPMVYRRVFEIK